MQIAGFTGKNENPAVQAVASPKSPMEYVKNLRSMYKDLEKQFGGLSVKDDKLIIQITVQGWEKTRTNMVLPPSVQRPAKLDIQMLNDVLIQSGQSCKYSGTFLELVNAIENAYVGREEKKALIEKYRMFKQVPPMSLRSYRALFCQYVNEAELAGFADVKCSVEVAQQFVGGLVEEFRANHLRAYASKGMAAVLEEITRSTTADVMDRPTRYEGAIRERLGRTEEGARHTTTSGPHSKGNFDQSRIQKKSGGESSNRQRPPFESAEDWELHMKIQGYRVATGRCGRCGSPDHRIFAWDQKFGRGVKCPFPHFSEAGYRPDLRDLQDVDRKTQPPFDPSKNYRDDADIVKRREQEERGSTYQYQNALEKSASYTGGTIPSRLVAAAPNFGQKSSF